MDVFIVNKAIIDYVKRHSEETYYNDEEDRLCLDFELNIFSRIMKNELKAVKEIFSQNEANFLLEIMHGIYDGIGSKVLYPFNPYKIINQAENSQNDGYPEYWEVDYESLMKKLYSLTEPQLCALVYWIKYFWRNSDLDIYEETSCFIGSKLND